MVYLDNAASTPLDPLVLEEMLPFMKSLYGNPSSIHAHGREAKTAIEKARKNIASLINAAPAEIFFTSCGTEADNTALRCSIEAYHISHVITTAIEHHAVLHCLEELATQGKIKISFVSLDPLGRIDLNHLEELLGRYPNSLVSIMHANNELGNLNDIQTIARLCDARGALFHSDTVQTMGHYVHDLQALTIDFIVGSAHKFHGPKGVGFLYLNSRRKIAPLLYGGAQERNMRGGTENVYGIVGLSKALELAYHGMPSHHSYIQGLKDYMKQQLLQEIPGVGFNGDTDPAHSLYTVLNVSLPESSMNDMLLFNLDIHKISASGGSACSSGSEIGSHVLHYLNADPARGHVRFSFSKYNTKEEIDYTVKILRQIYS